MIRVYVLLTLFPLPTNVDMAILCDNKYNMVDESNTDDKMCYVKQVII